jgi:hypothetical protein
LLHGLAALSRRARAVTATENPPLLFLTVAMPILLRLGRDSDKR